VFDAYATAAIVDGTFGAALELDRALGLEANAAGTSYLAPVEQVLGTPIASPLVTLTGDRSMPGGVATVQWDDDGMTPRDFPLITQGVAVDYATSNEHAGTLASWYRRQGMPVTSNGCAAAGDALAMPLIRTPNLTLQPGAVDRSFLDLVAGVDHGIAILGGRVSMDQQQRNGVGMSTMAYRITKGKLAGTLTSVAYLFRTPEFWKGVMAIGGASSAAVRGFTTTKGQPVQTTVHSVRSVAVHVKQVRVVDGQQLGRTP
jgi:TldD protein